MCYIKLVCFFMFVFFSLLRLRSYFRERDKTHIDASTIGSILSQLNYEIALVWHSNPGVRQPWGEAPLLLDDSVPVCCCCEISLVLPGKHTIQSLVEKQSLLGARGELAYTVRSPWLWSLIDLKSTVMRSEQCSSDGW